MSKADSAEGSRRLAWVLLFWVLVPVVLPIVESVDAALPPGVFDDADDDSLIAALTSLDLTLVAPIPPPPPDLPRTVAGRAAVEGERPALSVSLVTSASRSPPLV